MRYDRSYIVRLIAKYLTQGLTAREQAILDEWAAESEVNRSILEEVADPERLARIMEDYEFVDPDIAWQQLVEREPELLRIESKDTNQRSGAADADSGGRTGGTAARSGKRMGWMALRLNRFKSWIENHRRLSANLAFAFVIVLLAGTTIFRLAFNSAGNRTPVYVHEPLSPAGYGASLQLAGGPVLELANMALGFIGSRGGLSYAKTEDGKVVITGGAFAGGRGASGGASAGGVSSGSSPTGGASGGSTAGGAFTGGRAAAGTLTTPKGAWFTAVLPDKTVVNLNAGSTLELFSCDNGPAREVMLTGEAFFDVAPERRSGRPFVVHVRRGKGTLNVVCLGTRFNVKAYEGGHVLTTLDQGRIQLEKNGHVLTTLDPGDAAIYNDDSVRKIGGQPAGVGSSWKDGKFDFEQEPVDQILDDLGRWYDARIEYTDKRPVTDTIYSLVGYRNQPLDTLVGRLSQDVGFHYKIDAGTLYVWH